MSLLKQRPLEKKKKKYNNYFVNNSNNKRIFIIKKTLLLLILFVIVKQILLIIIYIITIGSVNNNNNNEQIISIIQEETLLPCTYEQLYKYFTPTTTTIKKKKASSSKKSCWSLHDEIIRIPVTSIMNRYNPNILGNGYKGIVHTGIIQLDDKKSLYCIVAIKTDHCHSILQPMSLFKPEARTKISCIRPYTILKNDQSYIGGEYTATLIQHSHMIQQQQYNNNNNSTSNSSSSISDSNPIGIIPTWAIIVNNDKPQYFPTIRSIIPYWLLGGSKHIDTSVIGVILPYKKSFSKILSPNYNIRQLIQKHNWKNNITAIIITLLDAAIGLELLHNLSLVHQDLVDGNIGITINEKTNQLHSFIYDNTYVATTTVLDDNNNNNNKEEFYYYKNYCKNDPIPLNTYIYDHHLLKNNITDPKLNDVRMFISVIIQVIQKYYNNNYNNNNNNQQQLLLYKNLISTLQNNNNCTTATDIITILKYYSHKK